MNNNLKFEFNWDEVFEGIKQGVIRELSETNFKEAKDQVVNQLKSEIKKEIYFTYRDENELKEEIKNEIKDKVFDKLLEEARKEYKKSYEELFNRKVTSEFSKIEEEMKYEIKTKTVNKLYNDLYSGIQNEMNKRIKLVTDQLMNNFKGDNVKVNDIKINESDVVISKEKYNNLIHRSETLEALEQGGVDNWEWYGDSLKQYFGNDDKDED